MTWHQDISSHGRASVIAGIITGLVTSLSVLGLSVLYHWPSFVLALGAGIVAGAVHIRKSLDSSVVCPKCRLPLRRFTERNGSLKVSLRACPECAFRLDE